MRKKNTTILSDENLLICVDDSSEFSAAMNYACIYAQKNKSGLILLYVIEEENFRHWKGVESIMREEQKDQAKEILNKHLAYIKKSYLTESSGLPGQRIESDMPVTGSSIDSGSGQVNNGFYYYKANLNYHNLLYLN